MEGSGWGREKPSERYGRKRTGPAGNKRRFNNFESWRRFGALRDIALVESVVFTGRGITGLMGAHPHK